jgi:hypothetical protein
VQSQIRWSRRERSYLLRGNPIGGCVGGTTYCEEAICPACSAVDGIFLGGGREQSGFFDGLCPAIDPANACADLECSVAAASSVLSPSCVAALTSLAERFVDGGLDGG